MCSEIACRFWLPSSRLIVIVNGEKPPAWMLVVPAVSDGSNGRLAPGHGRPFGPEVIWKDEDVLTGPVAVPRRERRLGRVRPAARGRRQRRAFPTEEMQFEFFKRQVRACS